MSSLSGISDTSVSRIDSIQYVKDLLIHGYPSIDSPVTILESLATLFQRHESTSDIDTKKSIELEIKNIIGTAVYVVGLESHAPMSLCVTKDFRPLAIEVANQIVMDYKCNTAAEKSLAEIIALSYVRILDISRVQLNCWQDHILSHERNNYYSMIGKEIDRAHKQYISALSTLKQMKSPPIELNVRAKNAYIATNQQVNNQADDKGEIINA